MKYTQNNAGDISRLRIHDSAFTGFDYRAEQSSVKITCRNEYLCKTYQMVFRNVICIHMQSYRFWGSGNSIQCIYRDGDELIDDLIKEQNVDPELYGGSRLADHPQMFTIGMAMNSGDVLTICCSEVEVDETDG